MIVLIASAYSLGTTNPFRDQNKSLNFSDFLKDYEKEQILVLKGKTIEINGLHCFIQDIKLESKLDVFTLITDNNIHLKCKTEDLTQIEKKILKEEI